MTNLDSSSLHVVLSDISLQHRLVRRSSIGFSHSLVLLHCSPGDQFVLLISDSDQHGNITVTLLMKSRSRLLEAFMVHGLDCH